MLNLLFLVIFTKLHIHLNITDHNLFSDKKLEIQDIPLSYVKVDVILEEKLSKKRDPTVMFAGLVGMEWEEDGASFRPSVGWAIALRHRNNLLVPHEQFEIAH